MVLPYDIIAPGLGCYTRGKRTQKMRRILKAPPANPRTYIYQ